MAEGTAKQGMEQPFNYYVPGIAPAGITFYTGEIYPAWRYDLFSSTLRGPVNRILLDGETILGEENLLPNWWDRLRDVADGPDGYLYLATESGRISRIVPVEQ